MMGTSIVAIGRNMGTAGELMLPTCSKIAVAVVVIALLTKPTRPIKWPFWLHRTPRARARNWLVKQGKS